MGPIASAIARSRRETLRPPDRSDGLRRILAGVLISGSDTRLALDPLTGRNCYGCEPVPRPRALAFSSSTASTISPRAYAAVEAAARKLALAAAREGSAEAYERRVEQARGDLHALLDVDPRAADIVFSPSGTDTELLALALARGLIGGDLACVMTGADETGTGVAQAAAGRHFSGATSSGQPGVRGDAIRGFGAVTAIPVHVRDAQGARSLADIDAEVCRAVDQTVADGKRVLLHVMDHGKLGSRGPSPDCIAHLRRAHGPAVQIVVDACQFRLSRARVHAHLDAGCLVQITGSKFFAGPPLSGALLVPASLRERIGAAAAIPEGLADYSVRADWPERLRAVGEQLPRRNNLGQLMRWIAAIEEMRAYLAVPELFRGIALASFAAAVSQAIAAHPDLRLLPEPAWVASEPPDGEFGTRTIFPFVVTRGGKPVPFAHSQMIFRALNEDVSDLASMHNALAAQLCHVGQPVPIADGAGGTTGALRVSADARLVSGAFTGGDLDTSIAAMKPNLDALRVVFAKAEMLAANLDALEAFAPAP